MRKIEAIIRPTKLEDIKDVLNKYGIHGMTLSQVMGCGKQKGHKEIYRGTEYNINLLPKVKVEIVVKDADLESILDLLQKTACTGEIGDGKIFVSNIEETVRIRTGERGDAAI